MSTTRLLQPNRAELAVLRGKDSPASLQAWLTAFAKGNPDRARRYTQALMSFLGPPAERGHRAAGSRGEWRSYLGRKSPHTQESYATAITEFFEWIARKRGRIVSPEDVTRLDAGEYVNYLANPRENLAVEKVHDGDRQIHELFVDIIEKGGKMTFLQIMQQYEIRSGRSADHVEAQLMRDEVLRRQFRLFLGKMVVEEILKTDPTVEKLRSEEVVDADGKVTYPYAQLGISLWERNGVPYEFLFSYELASFKKAAPSTIAVRIAALSSFWQILSKGENIAGGEPLLKYDVWVEVKKKVNANVGNYKKEAANQKLITEEEMVQILKFKPRTMVELRNRAIVFLLFYTGIRSAELLQLRFGAPRDDEAAVGWFEETPPALHIIRKGNKPGVVPYPEIALVALRDFYEQVRIRAAPEDAQKEDPRAPGYIPPKDPSWLYQQLGRHGTPLFPSLAEWGNNQKHHGNVRHLTRDALAKLLRGYAKDSGLTEGQIKRMHPHAFRHLFATSAVAAGVDIYELAARMGHNDIRTSQGYIRPPSAASTVAIDGQLNEHLRRTTGDAPAAPSPRVTLAAGPRAAAAPAPTPTPQQTWRSAPIEAKGEEVRAGTGTTPTARVAPVPPAPTPPPAAAVPPRTAGRPPTLEETPHENLLQLQWHLRDRLKKKEAALARVEEKVETGLASQKQLQDAQRDVDLHRAKLEEVKQILYAPPPQPVDERTEEEYISDLEKDVAAKEAAVATAPDKIEAKKKYLRALQFLVEQRKELIPNDPSQERQALATQEANTHLESLRAEYEHLVKTEDQLTRWTKEERTKVTSQFNRAKKQHAEALKKLLLFDQRKPVATPEPLPPPQQRLVAIGTEVEAVKVPPVADSRDLYLKVPTEAELSAAKKEVTNLKEKLDRENVKLSKVVQQVIEKIADRSDHERQLKRCESAENAQFSAQIKLISLEYAKEKSEFAAKQTQGSPEIQELRREFHEATLQRKESEIQWLKARIEKMPTPVLIEARERWTDALDRQTRLRNSLEIAERVEVGR